MNQNAREADQSCSQCNESEETALTDSVFKTFLFGVEHSTGL